MFAFYNFSGFLNDNPFLRDQTNNKFYGKNAGFEDSGFVKTCDEPVLDLLQERKTREIQTVKD